MRILKNQILLAINIKEYDSLTNNCFCLMVKLAKFKKKFLKNNNKCSFMMITTLTFFKYFQKFALITKVIQ